MQQSRISGCCRVLRSRLPGRNGAREARAKRGNIAAGTLGGRGALGRRPMNNPTPTSTGQSVFQINRWGEASEKGLAPPLDTPPKEVRRTDKPSLTMRSPVWSAAPWQPSDSPSRRRAENGASRVLSRLPSKSQAPGESVAEGNFRSKLS